MGQTTKKSDFKVGGTIKVPMHLSSGTLEVACVILDERHIFGRHEVEVSPLEGTGEAWVRVDRIQNGTGPTANRPKSWQQTHNLPPASGTPVPHDE